MNAPRRLSLWKVALLAPLPLLALLLLLEGTLWLFGLGDPDERLSLTRGFSESARYLLPNPEQPGGYITQTSDGSFPEQVIAPKGKRLRVVLFGGSNTQGFPTHYFEELLNEAAPAPGFEVINLGRSGYGSERVLILLRQALVLKPDLVLLYLGHNEFVERGFAMELVTLWRQPWMLRAAERLSRLRTLNVAVTLLQAAGAESAATTRPEERRERPEEFRGFRYEDTLVVYDVYRRNLSEMVRLATESGAGVLLSTVVGNMLFAPVVPGTPEGYTADDVNRQRKALAAIYARIPARLIDGLIQTSAEPIVHLDPRDWGEALPSADLEARRAEWRAAGGPPQPPALRSLSAPFHGGPFWTEPEIWSARPMNLLPTVAALHERKLTPEERAQLEKADALLTRLRSEVPDQALVLHASGIVSYALGHDEAAVQFLRDAARFDRAPTRGNDVTNGIVRDIAAAHPEIHFVDTEDIVRAACPSGLIGYELMTDNCHLHRAAVRRLMALFVPGLVELSRGRTAAAASPAPAR
ncbi:MAG: SGNH/GDSL hydrolase family protein [Planctomycetota bacterium]